MKTKIKLVSVLLLSALVCFGCRKDESGEPVIPEQKVTPIKDEGVKNTLKGKVDLIYGSNHDYVVYSEIDKSNVNEVGEYGIAKHSTLVAVNKTKNKPVYYSLTGKDKDCNLNAKETAIYLTALTIPYIREGKFKKIIAPLKKSIYKLEEVKVLEKAIDKCIKQKGYLDLDVIENELNASIAKMFSLREEVVKTKSSNRRIASYRANSQVQENLKWVPKFSAGRFI